MITHDLFSNDEIHQAYRKLKSFIYHDNFSLFLRERLAEYETSGNLEEKLTLFQAHINKQSKLKTISPYFLLQVKELEIHVLPKKFSDPSGENLSSPTLISNRFLSTRHVPSRFFYFIDASIEIHLISVLWIMRYGYLLDKSISQHSYAYKVWLDESNTNSVVNGLRLFKPYYSQYQTWRDRAIKTVKALATDRTDSVMISLDIKDYFHSVELDFDEMLREVHPSGTANGRNIKGVNVVLKKVHEAYATKVQKADQTSKNTILPIGLLSSGIIANWYLKKFDEKVIEELSPAYYGRYVDDILIVLSNSKLDYTDAKGAENAQRKFLQKYFIDREVFEWTDKSMLKLRGYRELLIQADKVRFFEVDGRESNAILDNFEKKIGDNNSAFWFLPEDDAVSREFNEEANVLTYTDSINKLRSIAGVHTSKYGASVFLAKKIKSALLSKKKKDDKATFQLLSFFRNRRNLDLFGLWEKAITYFVVNNQQDDFWLFYLECMTCVQNISAATEGEEGEKNKSTVRKLTKGLIEYFELCLAMAVSLHPEFINNGLKRKLLGANVKKTIRLTVVFAKAQAFRKANMMRHHYVVHPLLNYSTHCYQNPTTFSLIDRGYPKEITPNGFEIAPLALLYSPRYVRFNETASIKIYKEINETALKGSTLGFDSQEIVSCKLGAVSILDESFDLFYKINYEYSFNGTSAKEELKENYYRFNTLQSSGSQNPPLCEELVVRGGSPSITKLSVLVANHRIDEKHVESSIKHGSILSVSKKENLIRLLNEAERLRGELLVLPENCTPFAWMPLLVEEARNKQRAIVCGLEHLNVSGVIFNFILTVLPIKIGDINDAVVVLRLKNHYSPQEKFLIKGLGKIVPSSSPMRYHLMKWKGVSFSVYNCFELADIEHRALFKSKVDLLVASEYNKDVNYFSNIVESVTRDVHCYFVQANSSDFGDSRITVPSSTQKMNILRLKGGENSTVLKTTLDIDALRNFQHQHYGLQRESEEFKPTPPNFDHNSPTKR